MVKVKICGITNLEDAKASIDAGCDALGFVFYTKSPRYINPRKVRQIIRGLAANTVKVGVFVNAREDTVKRIAKSCGLDILQFHGRESPEFCQRFKSYKIIKSFRIKDKINLADVSRYRTFAYLFDTFVKEKPGGTGKKFDWRLIRHTAKLRQPVFLSGGLRATNVCKAIKIAKPDWVDVSSSLEIKPGRKDKDKIRRFMKAARKR